MATTLSAERDGRHEALQATAAQGARHIMKKQRSRETARQIVVWEVEKETKIDRVVMHLESVHFAIAITQGRMDELKDQLGRAVARLVQLKPDCTDELKMRSDVRKNISLSSSRKISLSSRLTKISKARASKVVD
jgi:chromosome segregation ATPase